MTAQEYLSTVVGALLVLAMMCPVADELDRRGVGVELYESLNVGP